jgi:hypothetical protein
LKYAFALKSNSPLCITEIRRIFEEFHQAGVLDLSKFPPWQSINDKIRDNTSSDGVVMLLPGQRLEGSLYTASLVTHLTSEEVQFVVSFSQIPELKYLEKPLRLHPRAECVAGEAANMARVSEMASYEFDSFSTSLRPKSLPMLAVLGIFYGGLHSSSWNGPFPTAKEQLLWRIASCVVQEEVRYYGWHTCFMTSGCGNSSMMCMLSVLV